MQEARILTSHQQRKQKLGKIMSTNNDPNILYELPADYKFNNFAAKWPTSTDTPVISANRCQHGRAELCAHDVSKQHLIHVDAPHNSSCANRIRNKNSGRRTSYNGSICSSKCTDSSDCSCLLQAHHLHHLDIGTTNNQSSTSQLA